MKTVVQCEIVSVDCPQFLVNSRRHACRYETIDGAALAAGHYLVVWPVGASLSSYGADLDYLGPHPAFDVARWLQVSALTLGIVRPVTADTERGAKAAAPGAQPILAPKRLVRVGMPFLGCAHE